MAERFMTRMSVFVVLQNKQGKLLLQQRANTGYLDGYWDFPSGHVEYGEPIPTAAARELLEEVGVSARPADLQLIHIDQYFLNKNYINFAFLLRQWQGDPAVCEPEKCSAVGWFDVSALPTECTNVVRTVARAGFAPELKFTVTDENSYQSVMGEPFKKPKA